MTTTTMNTSSDPESDTQTTTTTTANALADRWPITPQSRAQLVKMALHFCGIDVTGEGTIVAMTPTDGSPKADRRTMLSAMRVMASFDRLSIEQQKLDLIASKQEARIAALPQPDPPPLAPELADKVLKLIEDMTNERNELRAQGLLPPLVPSQEEWTKTPDLPLGSKTLQPRWPLTNEARGAIIATALSLCGFALTTDGTLVPDPESNDGELPNPRIVLGALRVLASYDRIAIEQRKIDLRVRAYQAEIDAEEATRPPSRYDMVIVAAVDKLIYDYEKYEQSTKLV
jgi:hypothetical protein